MSSDELIGPALPPMFRNRESDEDSDSDEGFSGPALPPGYKRGEPSSSSEDSEEEVTFKRAKTSHTAAQSSAEKVEDTKVQEPDEDGFFGPALPPGFMKQQSSPERPPVLGPALPPGFCRAAYEDDDDDNKEEEDFPGPALPPGYQAHSSSSEGEDDVIGPMPHKGPVEDSTALDFERRARKMKDKLTGDDTPEVVARETWMTVLPPELQHIGLGARTFKKKSGPENKDRSMWTDTPEDRERKIRETKRAESLVSMHTKTMKEKAKKKVDVPVERRAFDRDEDLQVNRFDEAQKERLLKKSQELNTRFSHSRDRMFL
ncbi:hypothetical protein JOQ06_009194 [Pogonophryne albipinna]|uniref:GPALPP motifs-containing protein 1 n=1 Tax=Pogonophryne albipinna TaxID=1090488 RepID=A0AAD6BNN3_9TELE|nr:hypothetical protein JOQ06_009194 [Pogonophryne albipinna]